MILRIDLTSDDLGYAGAVRYGRHSGVADEGVDLASFLEEQVPDLDEKYTGGGRDDEGGRL